MTGALVLFSVWSGPNLSLPFKSFGWLDSFPTGLQLLTHSSVGEIVWSPVLESVCSTALTRVDDRMHHVQIFAPEVTKAS